MSREVAVVRSIDGKLQPRAVDGAIAALAEGQHGVVGRRQLLALGVGGDAIDGRLRRGSLHRLRRGVYSVGFRVASVEARWSSAVLAMGPGAVLSHRAAAALWRIRGAGSGLVDVTSASKGHARDGIRRHCASLPADEVTVERGIPVTSVPRTILDLAVAGSVDEVERALRESEYLRLHDRLSLLDLLDRYPGRRGARVVRQCIARRAEAPPGRPRSRLEERFVPFLRHHRLPLPHLNAWVPLEPKGCEVDCLWPEARQIVELDGFAGHGTRGAFREDRVRDRRLRVAGYGVTRIAWAQLDDEPEEIAADLGHLLVQG